VGGALSDERGYITDVEYTGDFFPHLAPARLAYIATINGHRAPGLDGRFTWCELGCGQGITALVLAATHPSGEFHACDFNAAQIERAEALRRAGGVDNLRFHARSFGEMLDEDLPPLDFIVLHGVYSWVPEAARGEIREFIRRRLAPGGLVMASYNAMPGWAHLQPIRRMMRAHAEAAPGSSLDKARAAFAYLDFLARNRASYFAALPAAADHLAKMATQDIRYVAHEYLTPHGDPFWFDEVAAAMATAGLAFAGSMTPADNYPELMMPAAFRSLVESAPTRAALEAHRDVVANTSFRQDLYVAQAPGPLDPAIGLAALAGTAFCLAGLPDALPLKRAQGWLQFDLTDQAAAVRVIHARLAGGPASAVQLHTAARTGNEDETAFLIQQLVVSGHLAPCPPVRPPAGWMQVNSALIEAGIREQRREVPLACPLTGSASYFEPVSAAAIEAAARIGDADTAGRQVLARLRCHGHPVNRYGPAGERSTVTDAEIVEHVASVWRGLRDPANPDRRRLQLSGVLA
jgi:trans-aconitate methyltransferase